VLERATAAAASGAEGESLRILRDKPQEDVTLCTDADRLSQVFINLISNARKYCDAPEPQLRITVQQRDGVLEIDFIDNGRGIQKADQSIIFEKFARLSDQSAAGSAGLGLAICREIVTRLDGDIHYLPGQGGGAFRVRLPLEAAR